MQDFQDKKHNFGRITSKNLHISKKIRTFAADFENKRIMTDVRFPKITLTVEAKPWPANHVARVTSFRPVSTRARQPRIIEAQVLAQ